MSKMKGKPIGELIPDSVRERLAEMREALEEVVFMTGKINTSGWHVSQGCVHKDGTAFWVIRLPKTGYGDSELLYPREAYAINQFMSEAQRSGMSVALNFKERLDPMSSETVVIISCSSGSFEGSPDKHPLILWGKSRYSFSPFSSST